MINPKDFFRFGSENFELLKDLHAREAINDFELRHLIMRHRATGAPAVEYIANQLISLGYLEEAPYATASLELRPPVRKFLDFVLRQQQLTPIAVIRSYIEALDQMGRDLDVAIERKETDNALRILSECNEIIERMRNDSTDNLEAIIRQTLAIKSNLEKKSVRERYMIVNRIREKYLVPLRELIDIKKPVQQSIDQIQRLFKDGKRTFIAHRALAEEFSRANSRLLRLRKSIRADFNDSRKEVDPLYKTLKRENLIIKGASTALELIDRKGLKALDMNFSITFMRVEGMVSDDKLESYLQKLSGYKPSPPQAIEEQKPESIAVDFIDPILLQQELKKDLPVSDCFEWLLENFNNESLGSILQAYAYVLESDKYKSSHNDERKIYKKKNYTIKTCQMTVEKG
ncbi:MAG: hypothetical protein GY705_14245 [Bacteroidetes bacterium]|nr:hypothetical protein [Bacteroidota bacterium]